LLSGYAGVPPGALRFEYDSAGKPRISPNHGEEIRFNLSHSGDWVVLALVRGAEIGVDLELIRQVPTLISLAERFFSEREFSILNSREGKDREILFFRLWTCKEAVLKAIGKGLTYPLEKVEVPWLCCSEVCVAHSPIETILDRAGDKDGPLVLDRVHQIQIDEVGLDPMVSSRWWVVEFIPAFGYIGALAIDRQPAQVEFFTWNGLTSAHTDGGASTSTQPIA